jgi:hypothetical protein
MKMKLTKNWVPLLGIYLIIGGLMGIVASGGNCVCKDTNNWWIVFGLFVGACVWLFHQYTSQPEPIKKIKKRRKKK